LDRVIQVFFQYAVIRPGLWAWRRLAGVAHAFAFAAMIPVVSLAVIAIATIVALALATVVAVVTVSAAAINVLQFGAGQFTHNYLPLVNPMACEIRPSSCPVALELTGTRLCGKFF
jgi:hypothetical protein